MTPQHKFRPILATAFLGRVGSRDIWELGGEAVICVSVVNSQVKYESIAVATIERLRGCGTWMEAIVPLLWRRRVETVETKPPEPALIEVVIERPVYVTSCIPLGEQDVYGFNGREYLGKTKPTGYRIGLSNGNGIVVHGPEAPELSRPGIRGRRFELVLREVR